MNVLGYNFIRADHLPNTKRGGVCICFKESLPLRLHNVSYLSEWICFEIMILNKLYNFISLYISPSQCSNQFENFVYNLDLMLEALTQKNPFLTVIIGDFNAKFSELIKRNLLQRNKSKVFIIQERLSRKRAHQKIFFCVWMINKLLYVSFGKHFLEVFFSNKMQNMKKLNITGCIALNILPRLVQNIHLEVSLGKGVLKIGSKFSGKHPYESVTWIKLQLYWNYTWTWVFSCKFALYI